MGSGQRERERERESRQPRHVYWADEAWGRSNWQSSREGSGSGWSWSSESEGPTQVVQNTTWNQGWSPNRNWETDSESSSRSGHSSASWKSAREWYEPGLHHEVHADDPGTSSSLSHDQGRRAEVYAGDWRRPTPEPLAGGHGVPVDAAVAEESHEVTAESPLSPGAPAVRDTWNKPTGEVPSGVPSIAGGAGGSGSGQAGSGGGKISTTYPPIFYARPGESWEQYWRTVTFWLASEGKSLPVEMRGPRLMQQLRERAGKIVQHLTVEEVTSIHGVDIIKKEMEKSPIIRLLDNKKIDKCRQKFMKLARLPNESIESFINRAEIYRRENEASPAYRVGSCFYVGHLLDSSKLTRKDFALLKAACGGDIEDETKVISAMLELAEQVEGAPYCPIGRGEPQLDNEDQYLVQKPGATSSTSTSASDPPSVNRRRPFPRARGGRFATSGRRRFRDALVAILEDEGDEDLLEETLADVMGEDSVDEDEEKADNPGDMTEFTPPSTHDAFVASGSPGDAAGSVSPLAEIYAQEFKARNRVREIKKMRQYFQKEAPGGPTAARGEHVKKWVAEQQKKEPCFICHQLGHWSQECPYRRRDKNVHAANVTLRSHKLSSKNGLCWSHWPLLECIW